MTMFLTYFIHYLINKRLLCNSLFYYFALQYLPLTNLLILLPVFSPRSYNVVISLETALISGDAIPPPVISFISISFSSLTFIYSPFLIVTTSWIGVATNYTYYVN